MLSRDTGDESNGSHCARPVAPFAVVSLLVLGAFAGGGAARPDDADPVVHNQTQVLDEHDEIHTINRRLRDG